MPSAKITQDPLNEIPIEVLAKDIQSMAAAMRKLNQGRLKQEAVVVLLHAMTGLARRDIKAVLKGMADLETTWLKPLKKE